MDWIAALFTLVATYLMADHRHIAVYVFLWSSVIFLVWALREQIWSIAVLQSVLVLLNIRTLYKWR